MTPPPSARTVETADLPDLGERLLVDTSEREPVYLLATKSGRYLRLAPSAYHLLREKSSGASSEALASALSLQTGRNVSSGEVDEAYQNVIERIEQIEGTPQQLPGGFWLRKQLIPERVVTTVAGHVSFAFHPLAAAVLLAGILAAGVSIAGHSFRLTTQALGWGYVLFFLSLFAHEFGHASACARYGARPSDIGFAVYLVYPCFYSDVSAAWRLKRWQRVVIDLGGTYFQLIAAAIYAALYALYGWEPLKVALVLIGGSCAFSLNPIFKFDGYWVAADALGVTNLARQPIRIVKHVRDRLLRKAMKPLPWPGYITLVLFFYTLLTFAVWGMFIWFVLPYLGERLLSYPALAAAFARHVSERAQLPDGNEVRSFLISTYVVLLGVLLLGRMVKRILAFVRARLPHPTTQPVPR
jgi:putative peptide zinc metalloprotease protein